MVLSGAAVNRLAVDRYSAPSRQGVDFLVAQMPRNDRNRDREGRNGLGQPGYQWPRSILASTGRQYEHRDILIFLDEREHLLSNLALADHLFGNNSTDAAGAGRRLRKHGARFIMGLLAHNVGHAEPLLITVLCLDHAAHQHLRPNAGAAAAR